MPGAGVRAQQVQENLLVPLERYSVVPYLYQPWLMLQGTSLSETTQLDIVLTLKYQKQPWRIFESQSGGFRQAPVEDQLQISPALAFSLKNWFSLALAVPLSYQTAGPSDMFPSVTGQAGTHLLNPQVYLKVPFLHERLSGFGLAAAGILHIPVGADQAFVNYPAWQGGLALAADWIWGTFGMGLNTGVMLREKSALIEERLRTDIGHEFFVRPGLFYAFETGGYQLAIVAEGNLATSLSGFFSEHNENAYQLLLSIHFGPVAGGGFFASAGSGARMQGGGYAVPLADFEARLGYSLQFAPTPEIALAQEQKTPSSPGTPKPSEPPKPAQSEGEWQKPADVKQGAYPAPEEAEEVAATEEAKPTGKTPGRPSAIEISGESPAQPVKVASRINFPSGPSLIQLSFEPNQPASREGMTSGSAVIPESVRQKVREQKAALSARFQEPGARLVIIGFADKCFEGPPPLGNQYNLELSQRRAEAMLQLLKEELPEALRGVQIKMVAMGRRCANTACNCATPEMSECAADRRVELFVDHGETDAFSCPAGEYWLAR